MIRARVGFSRRPDGYVRTLGYAVHDRMDGNPHFPNPPVKLSDLKAALISFDHAIAAAVADGGKKAFAQKKKCRHVVATMLRQLGHYVEAACDGNLAAFIIERIRTYALSRRNRAVSEAQDSQNPSGQDRGAVGILHPSLPQSRSLRIAPWRAERRRDAA